MEYLKLTILASFFLASCGRPSQKEGQVQPLTSPSGKYTVEMPILRSNPDVDYPVWTPTIKNKYLHFNRNSDTIKKENMNEQTDA